MKNCDVIDFVENGLIAGQFVRFKHGDDMTRFVCCIDFVDAFNDFVRENPAMGDYRFLPKVKSVIPSKCKFDNGKDGIVMTIVLSAKNTTVWHCANSVDLDGCESRPIEE